MKEADAYAVLEAYIEQRIPLGDEERLALRQLFRLRSLKRHELLHPAGEPARYGAFVVRGCLRSFVVDAAGKEHILQFAPEQWWISDQHSLVHQTPALFAIDAVEDSDVLLFNSLYYLHPTLPNLRAPELGLASLNNRIHAMQKRLVLLLSAPARTRYLDFLETYPMLAQRLPLKLIAAYLGITPESLSRVRHELSNPRAET